MQGRTQQKRQDKSVQRAEKQGSAPALQGFAARADRSVVFPQLQTPGGTEGIDLPACSGDACKYRHATWGMSVEIRSGAISAPPLDYAKGCKHDDLS
jgi:hypothetical protein